MGKKTHKWGKRRVLCVVCACALPLQKCKNLFLSFRWIVCEHKKTWMNFVCGERLDNNSAGCLWHCFASVRDRKAHLWGVGGSRLKRHTAARISFMSPIMGVIFCGRVQFAIGKKGFLEKKKSSRLFVGNDICIIAALLTCTVAKPRRKTTACFALWLASRENSCQPVTSRLIVA